MKEAIIRDMIEPVKLTFIADANVGKLAKRLRMLGFDTLFVSGIDDDELIRIALKEGRIILTKDRGILHRRIVSIGKVRAILIESDKVREQIRQVIDTLGLGPDFDTFSLCMECNESLEHRGKEEVHELVPPYVRKTQEQYMQCPRCERIYWRGTHWEKMSKELEGLFTG